MKKLIAISLGLLLATSVVAQNFVSEQFLNVTTLTVTNARAYTNPAVYFGGPGILTNTTGLVYTNFTGANKLVGTNDTTLLIKDVPLIPLRDGSSRTNFVLGFAATFGSATTGNVALVFAPIIKGPLQPSSEVTVLGTNTFLNAGTTFVDLTNIFNVNIPVTIGGFNASTLNIDALTVNTLGQAKGLRLISITPTNVNGAITLYDLSLEMWVP